MASPALQTLLISAQLLGVDPKASLPPPAPASAAPQRTVVSRAALADVAKAQEGAWLARACGGNVVELAAAFDAKGELWLKLRQDGRALAFPRAALENGAETALPAGRLRLSLVKGTLTLTPLDAAGPAVSLDTQLLAKALFDAARHEKFPPVDYALAYEDGSSVPGSVSLIRADAQGNFFVNYHGLDELAKISWFVGINGTLYGVALEGRELVFYSEPVPPLRARPAVRR